MKKTMAISFVLFAVGAALTGCAHETSNENQNLSQNANQSAVNVNQPAAETDQNDYPQKISTYVLQSADPESECQEASVQTDVRGISGEICREDLKLEYTDAGTGSRIIVQLTKITKGKEAMMEIIRKYSRLDRTLSPVLFRPEKFELGWIPESQYDMIVTQEYPFGNLATGDNAVIKYFLEAYPIDEKEMNKLNPL